MAAERRAALEAIETLSEQIKKSASARIEIVGWRSPAELPDGVVFIGVIGSAFGAPDSSADEGSRAAFEAGLARFREAGRDRSLMFRSLERPSADASHSAILAWAEVAELLDRREAGGWAVTFQSDHHLAGRLDTELRGLVDAWLKTLPTLPQLPLPKGSTAEPSDGLAPLRTQLQTRTGTLADFFRRAGGPQVLNDVYVEVGLRSNHTGTYRDMDLPRADGHLRAGETCHLVDVLKDPHNRWVLLGDPGSGKTTLLHHLIHELLEGAAPTPILFKISELKEGCTLASVTQRVYGPDVVEPATDAAARGELVILLDGLDEAVDAHAARAVVHRLAADAGRCQVIITSRHTGYDGLGGAFRELVIRDLEPEQQHALLHAWTGDGGRAQRSLEKMRRRPRLKRMAGNPLLLTLVGLLLREKPDVDLPERRGALYRLAISQLLMREYALGGASRRLREPDVAEAALARVALALHGARGEIYPTVVIRRALQGDSRVWADIEGIWRGLTPFLEELSTCTGVLVREGGDESAMSGAWRFPHRTFREYLAAHALAGDITIHGMGEVPQDALIGAAKKEVAEDVQPPPGALGIVLADAVERPPIWSEVLALTCGLMEPQGADRLVRRVALARNTELLLRVVAEAENIREDTVLAVFGVEKGGRHWKARKEVLEQLPALVKDASAVVRLTWKFIQQTTNGNDLYFARELLRHVAEGTLEGGPDFRYTAGDSAEAADLAGHVFEHMPGSARLGVQQALANRLVSVANGRFAMGNSERGGDEYPAHWVALSGFNILKTPVTNALYECFDPGHRDSRAFETEVASDQLDEHPVVNVTWYEAVMFAEWAGARLPTEAEWEYTARGTRSTDESYPWGQPKPAPHRANFVDSDPHHTSKVGMYPSGVSWCDALDMAGNVWEWCADWYGIYSSQSQDNPTGPIEGTYRSFRGGSWVDPPDWLRSTYRNAGQPTARDVNIGFRVVVPAVSEAGAGIRSSQGRRPPSPSTA